jgi:hypothetical protein
MRVPWTAIGGIIGILASLVTVLQFALEYPVLLLILVVLAIVGSVVAIGAGAWYMVRRVRAAPHITRLDPPIGRIGDEVDAHGVHLPRAELEVVFGGNRTAELVGVRSARRVRARVPAGAQDGPLEIRTADGPTLVSPLPFIVAQPPQLHGVAPLLAPPGAEVTLSGAALYVGHTTVRFGDAAADIMRHADAAGLVVRVPAGAADGPIEVRTTWGIARSAAFTAAQPPLLDGIAPTLAAVNAEVTLSGAALYIGHTVAWFGDAAAEIVRHTDSTTLVVRVPAGAADGPIEVRTPGGTAQSAAFTVAQPPQLHGVAPTLAPVNAEVTLSGAALYVGHATVRFGRHVAEVVRHADAATLVVRVPAGAADGPIEARTTWGTAQSAAFTVALPPEIRRVVPMVAPPGAEVTLSGAALYAGHTTVWFGDVAADIVRHASAWTLVVCVPAGAPDGPIGVRTPGGVAQSAAFTVAQPPVVDGITPTLAPPGAEVTLSGATLYVGHTEVWFGDVVAGIVRQADATTLVVRVPAGALDGPIEVRTPGGSASSPAFAVGYGPPTVDGVAPVIDGGPPVVDGIAPTLAPVNAEVVLSGAALYVGHTTVRFGERAAEIVRHTDAATLVVRVPAGAADGPIEVRTAWGITQSAPFTVVQPRIDQAGAEYRWVPAGAGPEGFWMMCTPVTNAMWRAAVQAEAVPEPRATRAYNDAAKAQHPVVYVTREHARTYATWVGGRLPCDAEWTRAAQGGDGRKWPWGNTPPDATRANCRPHGPGDTTPVGACLAGASPYGLLDMAGNVWEWVDPDGGGDRPYIVRGGAFSLHEVFVVCGARYGGGSISDLNFVGFRVVFP